MNDTERIDKLESALRDPKLKLNITQNGDFVANIYDLRDWLDALAKPRAYRPPPVRTRKSKALVTDPDPSIAPEDMQ